MRCVMGNKITGKEYPLSKIFSSDFKYHIPKYQRPYAWTEVETGVLFDDLYDFYQTEQIDNYFLGSIVLIKDEEQRDADIIDGQQRLTTLSILLATITNAFETSKYKESCFKYLQDPGDIVEGTESEPRLFLREREQEFFRKYVQDIRLKELFQIDTATLDSEAKQHIQKNCKVLCDKLEDTFEDDSQLLSFLQFLINRCFLVVVSTPSQESAFRVFSVMNSRGLDLLPTDIIKSKTIGNLPNAEQAAYTEKWEDMENLIGRDGFNEIFTHTRTIFAKERPKKNLLEEFEEFVVKKVSPKELIEKYLVPYTESYNQLKNCAFASTQNAGKINELLRWLNKTNNYDWMPPAIKFLSEHPNDSAYILWFIRKLERLASYLLVTQQDVNHRMDRYNWVLVEMDSRPDSTLENPLVNIELTDWEKAQFSAALDGEIYTMTPQRRNYIIQRLDSFVSDGAASYDTSVFTIEHILPQHPSAESEWMQLWPDVDVQKYWINRIANLVPLTRKHNSAAQNYDFNTKKEKYFRSKNGTSSYTLTTQVLGIYEWTPDVVKNRQTELEKVFAENWELNNTQAFSAEDPIFNLAGRGANANGYFKDDNNFVVLKGSVISSDITKGAPPTISEQRKNLIASGIIKNNIFVEDYTFGSPSTASATILGRSSNGRKEWTKIDGRTIAQMGH